METKEPYPLGPGHSLGKAGNPVGECEKEGGRIWKPSLTSPTGLGMRLSQQGHLLPCFLLAHQVLHLLWLQYVRLGPQSPMVAFLLSLSHLPVPHWHLSPCLTVYFRGTQTKENVKSNIKSYENIGCSFY